MTRIEFAPLSIPFRRRFQTFSVAVIIWIYLFGPSIMFGLVIYALFYVKYAIPVAALYAAWFYYDYETPFKGGRKWPLIRYNPLWKFFIEYFPINLVKTADLPPDKNYILAVFPHGVFCLGAVGNFSSTFSPSRKVFPKIDFRPVTLDLNFKVPLFREYILQSGMVSASKRSLDAILSGDEKGKALILVVGGAAEAMYARPAGPYHVVLDTRKGFVVEALKNGCPLVPVFSFGEIDTYDQVASEPSSKLHRFQVWFKNKTGVFPLILKGRGIFQYTFGTLPFRTPITTVVGAPIDIPKRPHPSEEDVNHYHEMFKTKLRELFEEHKSKYIHNKESAKLIFV